MFNFINDYDIVCYKFNLNFIKYLGTSKKKKNPPPTNNPRLDLKERKRQKKFLHYLGEACK